MWPASRVPRLFLESCPAPQQARGWQGRRCHSGGLWGLIKEANMPQTLLRMQGCNGGINPEGAGLSGGCQTRVGRRTGMPGLSPQPHLQEGHRGHSGREGLER